MGLTKFYCQHYIVNNYWYYGGVCRDQTLKTLRKFSVFLLVWQLLMLKQTLALFLCYVPTLGNKKRSPVIPYIAKINQTLYTKPNLQSQICPFGTKPNLLKEIYKNKSKRLNLQNQTYQAKSSKCKEPNKLTQIYSIKTTNHNLNQI